MPRKKQNFLRGIFLYPGLLSFGDPYFVIDLHTDDLNHEAHEEHEVILVLRYIKLN
jgi:hypothetical protein